ncbi:hypothetical protein PUMCH_005053 [Australozyma saopauloensis]|uniref:Co-chaperone HscB C-terminal oligomerisation domain-containing protein n=1 Tax=Australozyma saopauloensis TaxID=291208 RepID=A0AAX4HGN9_9ASCO|nr:hypothetical protein PUMCH_005053 [[Candida] saopauloensis]
MFSSQRHISRAARRWASTGTGKNYFQLFPKSFPNQGPPKDLFLVNARTLRKEFRALQSQNHPDIIMGSLSFSENKGIDETSSSINRAYSVVKNPYMRAAHIIELLHPEHFDITTDETSKQLISKLKSNSAQSLNYEELLMTVLEAHEALEMANRELDLDVVQTENDERIDECEKEIAKLLGSQPIDWDKIIAEAIKLKYWANIANGIKEWEQGKPVLLTH